MEPKTPVYHFAGGMINCAAHQSSFAPGPSSLFAVMETEFQGSSNESVRTGADRAIILVVERDPHVRELESYFLHEAGFAVEFADDGVAALEMVRALTPAIVITEILVPKLDGLALCRTIKSDPALCHTVVLVFSILAAQQRAEESGADAFLLKPLAERRLVSTVRELLASRPSSGQGDHR